MISNSWKLSIRNGVSLQDPSSPFDLIFCILARREEYKMNLMIKPYMTKDPLDSAKDN